MRRLLCFLKYLWALPISCIGIMAIPFVLTTGGSVSIGSGIIEAEGGVLVPILSGVLRRFSIEAITIGHVIFGRTRLSITQCRAHELIHVRQYERWGLIFPFLYFSSSFIASVRGKDPYLDNVFEQEAFSPNGEER